MQWKLNFNEIALEDEDIMLFVEGGDVIVSIATVSAVIFIIIRPGLGSSKAR